jgi:hypothetical protein
LVALEAFSHEVVPLHDLIGSFFEAQGSLARLRHSEISAA